MVLFLKRYLSIRGNKCLWMVEDINGYYIFEYYYYWEDKG